MESETTVTMLSCTQSAADRNLKTLPLVQSYFKLIVPFVLTPYGYVLTLCS